ncbi:hypothetical protein Tco_1483660 [Tanacetum coccineum]
MDESRIQENLLDRVSQLHWPFSLPECLKADNTVKVNQSVVLFVSSPNESKSCVFPPNTKDKDPNKDWFKQPPRPHTFDLEWNKRQVVVDQPSAAKDPLTFDELMATLIEFSKYAMNRLKIDNLTQAYLVGPVYELLKGTCTSSIKLEYNMEECFKALINKLDWNNLEEVHFPFDLTKPLPLKGCLGRLTVTAEYFFNNDLEFLKSSDPEKKYITSITKTKAALYEILGIEDMVLALWSATKVGYNKDAEKGIKHWGEKRQLCVSVKKLHGYGHLEEIVVRRVDRQVYKFKEGDFIDLHLNDIEDMLLFAVQHSQNQSDLPRDISLDRIEVLRYDTKGVKVIKGKMQTKTGLTLEQTQQGVSDEVLVSIEGVEELKRNVKIEVKRKKPSLHVGRNQVNTYAIRNTKLFSGIEDNHYGPSDTMHNPSQPLKISERETNIELAASKCFKDVHHLDKDGSRYDVQCGSQCVGVIPKGKKTFGSCKCCVKINDLKDGERHETWLLLELICCEHRLVLPTELSDGFILEKMSSPLGVLVIFESRPEALVQS